MELYREELKDHMCLIHNDSIQCRDSLRSVYFFRIVLYANPTCDFKDGFHTVSREVRDTTDITFLQNPIEVYNQWCEAYQNLFILNILNIH
jgi:hypothetical protein